MNPSIGWRVLGGVSAVLAGIAARKAAHDRLAEDDRAQPARQPGHAGHPAGGEAIAFAVVSGAAMGLARMLATRKAAGYYQQSTGHLPPGMEAVT